MGGRRHRVGELASDLLERAVLQQPGEEQVPGLDEGEVLIILRAAAGEQPSRLQLEQRRRDEEELRGLAEVPLLVLGTHRLDMGDELVGDLGQGDDGDIELVLGDEAEEQVERALEDVEVDLEGRRPASAGEHPTRGLGDDRPAALPRAHVRPRGRGR